VGAVGKGIAAAGFQRLLLFNAHGGQIGLLETAARELRLEEPALAVLPCFLWRGADGLEELIPQPERSEGLHAGLAETSLILHLRPPSRGRDLPPADGSGPPPPAGWSLEGACPSAWLMGDVSASGVIGDPSGADEALGHQIFERLVSSWERRLDALLRSDWPPTCGRA
jgi:creatinine amidohydrolase